MPDTGRQMHQTLCTLGQKQLQTSPSPAQLVNPRHPLGRSSQGATVHEGWLATVLYARCPRCDLRVEGDRLCARGVQCSQLQRNAPVASTPLPVPTRFAFGQSQTVPFWGVLPTTSHLMRQFNGQFPPPNPNSLGHPLLPCPCSVATNRPATASHSALETALRIKLWRVATPVKRSRWPRSAARATGTGGRLP